MPRAAISDAVVEPLMLDFDEVFREHANLVFGTACEVTGKKEDAEDVVQTVFLRLLRRGLPPDFRRNPKSYLYRAAVNESLNIIRSRRRHPTEILEEVEAPLAPDDTDYHEIVHRRLYEAIAALHPVSAESVILRYVHAYSDAEIAKLLGTSRVTVAVRLHRARVQLKKLMRAFIAEEL
jgi:RNA polymerase sigma-70 factor, ECF subfamily